MLIQAVFGNETFRGGMSKYHLYAMPSRRFRLPQEMHINTLAVQAGNTFGVERHRASQTPAAGGSAVDMGSWTTAAYEVPEGMILKLFGTRTVNLAQYGGQGRGRPEIAAVLVRVRANAALRRIQCQQITDSNSTFGAVTLEGRFDLLTLKEAAKDGMNFDMRHAGQFEVREQRKLFSVTRLDHQIAAPTVAKTETVKAEDGKEVQVETARRKRHVSFD